MRELILQRRAGWAMYITASGRRHCRGPHRVVHSLREEPEQFGVRAFLVRRHLKLPGPALRDTDPE